MRVERLESDLMRNTRQEYASGTENKPRFGELDMRMRVFSTYLRRRWALQLQVIEVV
jgi:hypothetical protein